MGKARKPAKKPMPELLAAFFCEKAIEEKDGVFSIVRIVDTLTVTAVAPPPHGELIGLPISTLISFKAAGTKGKRNFTVTQVGPSEKRRRLVSQPVEFIGGITGANIRSSVALVKYEGDGVYWFEVRLENRLYTRMPLRVAFRVEPGTAPPAHPPGKGPSK